MGSGVRLFGGLFKPTGWALRGGGGAQGGGGGRLGLNHARMCVSKCEGNGWFFFLQLNEMNKILTFKMDVEFAASVYMSKNLLCNSDAIELSQNTKISQFNKGFRIMNTINQLLILT